MNRKIEEIADRQAKEYAKCKFPDVVINGKLYGRASDANDAFYDGYMAASNLLDQEMVKFAEWVSKNLYGYGGNDKWIKNNKITKTSELLTLYKAEMNTKECG